MSKKRKYSPPEDSEPAAQPLPGKGEDVTPYTLSPEMMSRINAYGDLQYFETDTVLCERGSRGVDLYVVVEGRIDLFEDKSDSMRRSVATLTKRQFSGELDSLSGREALLSCRTAKGSRILRVPHEEIELLMRTELDIADVIVRAWIARRASLMQHSHGGVIIIGQSHDAETMRMQQFLVRNGYPHKLIAAESNPTAEMLLKGLNLDPSEMPVVFLPDQRV